MSVDDHNAEIRLRIKDVEETRKNCINEMMRRSYLEDIGNLYGMLKDY